MGAKLLQSDIVWWGGDVDEVQVGKALERHSGVPCFKSFRVMLDKLGEQINSQDFW